MVARLFSVAEVAGGGARVQSLREYFRVKVQLLVLQVLWWVGVAGAFGGDGGRRRKGC